MAVLTWNHSYSVNVEELDRQHQKFFAMINSLHDAMSSGQGKQVLGTILDGLVAYTKTHFAHEERLMKLYQYPGLNNHKSVHDAFVRQAEDLQKQYKGGNTMSSVQVMSTLKNWLVKHILGSDKLYAPYFNEKGLH